MLDGGVIARRPYLLVGPAGSGKTTLALQFLCEGVRRGERGLLVTLEEPPNEARLNHRGLGPEFDRVEVFDAIPDVMRYERVPFKDISAVRASMPFGQVPFVIRRTPELTGVEVTITALEQMLRSEVTRRGFTRVVIDSLTALQYFCMKGFNEVAGAQTFLRYLSDLQVTTLLTVESPVEDADTTERMLARGEIRLFRWEHDNATVRAIGVEKFRGSSHDIRLHPYRIGPHGLDINLSVTVSRDTRQIIEGPAALGAPPVPTSKYAGHPIDPLIDQLHDLVAIEADVGPIRAEIEAALAGARGGDATQVPGHVARATALAMDLASAYRTTAPPDVSKRTPETSAALMRVVARASEARTGLAPTQLPPSPELERQLEQLLTILPAPRPAPPPPSAAPPPPVATAPAPPSPGGRRGVPRAFTPARTTAPPPPEPTPVVPVVQVPPAPVPPPELALAPPTAPPTAPPPAEVRTPSSPEAPTTPSAKEQPSPEVAPPVPPVPQVASVPSPAATPAAEEFPPPPPAPVPELAPLPPPVPVPIVDVTPLNESPPVVERAPAPVPGAPPPAPVEAAPPPAAVEEKETAPAVTTPAPSPPLAPPEPPTTVLPAAAPLLPPSAQERVAHPPPPRPAAAELAPSLPPKESRPAGGAAPVRRPAPPEPPALPSGLGKGGAGGKAPSGGTKPSPVPSPGVRDLAAPPRTGVTDRTAPPPLPTRAPPAPAPATTVPAPAPRERPAAPVLPRPEISLPTAPAVSPPAPAPSLPEAPTPVEPPSESSAPPAPKRKSKRAPKVPRKVEPKIEDAAVSSETAGAGPTAEIAPTPTPESTSPPAPPKPRKRAVRKKKAPSVISATEGTTPPEVQGQREASPSETDEPPEKSAE